MISKDLANIWTDCFEKAWKGNSVKSKKSKQDEKVHQINYARVSSDRDRNRHRHEVLKVHFRDWEISSCFVFIFLCNSQVKLFSQQIIIFISCGGFVFTLELTIHDFHLARSFVCFIHWKRNDARIIMCTYRRAWSAVQLSVTSTMQIQVLL